MSCVEILEKIWEILRHFGRFFHDLRAFMWRKIEPQKYICGEKMTNMMSEPPDAQINLYGDNRPPANCE